MQENSIKISPIKQRILQYLEFKGITPYKLYKETDISRGILGKPGGISEENISKFLLYCPDISEIWLLSGKGSMTKSLVTSETDATQKNLTDPFPMSSDICELCRQKDILIGTLREQVHDKQKLIDYLEDHISTSGHVQKRKASA